MFIYPNDYHSIEYRRRRLEEEAQKELIRQAAPGRKAVYAPILALMGRALMALGERMQGQPEALSYDMNDHIEPVKKTAQAAR
jgi:hypothetical protein